MSSDYKNLVPAHLKHGLYTYVRFCCRCELCLKVQRKYANARYQAKKAAKRGWE
jgi:hypothetical protein